MVTSCCNNYHKWAIVWIEKRESIDGPQRHFMGEPEIGMTQLYRTRAEARAECERQWGYIRNRPDLRVAPHGWRMPQVVKVHVSIEEVA